MKPYKVVDVSSEQRLEDLVRRHSDNIEQGLAYVDHQGRTSDGRFDVLMVDSGKALVVVELKATQDDGMLMQALDYYDYVSAHVEVYARLYADAGIDPTRPVRLVLIAQSFSATLLNRCKWIYARISLFAYQCLQFDGDEDLVPVFWEQDWPASRNPPGNMSIEEHLRYITDPEVQGKARALLDEIRGWRADAVVLDAIKDSVSIKVNNRVFAYFEPRRKFYLLWTYDDEENLAVYPVRSDADLDKIRPMLRTAMDRLTERRR